MKKHLVVLCAVGLFSAQCEIRAADPMEEGVERPVLKILKIKVPEKVTRVVWSIQREVCVVFIDFPSRPDHAKQPELPRTRVWLLKGDGTVISTTVKPSTHGISNANFTTLSTTYVFSASAKTEAAAVVVSIDGEFFVEKLSTDEK